MPEEDVVQTLRTIIVEAVDEQQKLHIKLAETEQLIGKLQVAIVAAQHKLEENTSDILAQCALCGAPREYGHKAGCAVGLAVASEMEKTYA
jgi:DNA repair exonuclease SbcCD ATPase subunit